VPVPPVQKPPDTIVPVKPRQGIHLAINGEPYLHTGDPDMPLLWYLRDVLRLTGTRYGCDRRQCGACTILVDGKRALACERPMRTVAGKNLTTVEGLVGPDGALHELQQAWIDEDAVLCGYCQPGWLMAAADLLRQTPDPSDADINALPNLCRCGSQPRIRRAIHRAARQLRGSST
jgi:isoquinoline 1-oxidoreductase alpha subunit